MSMWPLPIKLYEFLFYQTGDVRDYDMIVERIRDGDCEWRQYWSAV